MIHRERLLHLSLSLVGQKVTVAQTNGAIMEGISTAPEAEGEPAVVYSAEDVQVMLFGDAAVVAFRLLGQPGDDSMDAMEYFNTGTFVKRPQNVLAGMSGTAKFAPPPTN